ncbi:putative chloroplast RF21 chloroplast [Cinnamomum micranthum f. kanehirae]|uniref:Putative chloroplast RF21 chloroplast n=1 Tax=Cinnamomum micranthum f. kanehirae TaxID=337451 RepID=A0A3S3NF85_9MAGN|nr:putative chloroplast RF21 chloroplast [Cinnamomum micranthum f. kanehirae]
MESVPNMPWFLTSTGCKYLNFILLETSSDPLLIRILSSKSFLSEEMIHRKNDRSIDMDLRSPNARENQFARPFPSSCCLIYRAYTSSLGFPSL